MEQMDLSNPVHFDEMANTKSVWNLRQYLLDTKYTTYARLMSVYPVRFDADPKIAPAYTDGKAIHIAQGMNLAEQSLAVRHELLHILLKHRDEDTWGKQRDDHMIRNVAGDAELSNYYDDEDNLLFGYDGILKDGINVRVNQSEWLGKTAPEVYDMVKKKQKKDKNFQQAIKDFKDKNPFGDCVPSEVPKAKDTDVDPATGKQGAGVKGGKLTKDQADKILKEIEQTTSVSHSPFAGATEGDLGTVNRTAKKAEVKLYVSLTRYFSHAEAVGYRRSYSSPHKQSTSTMLKRGRRRSITENKTLVMYIDRSGSMTDEKTGKADKIVENTIKRLRDVTVIKKYFANRIGEGEEHSDGYNLGGGTNYQSIKQDVEKNGYRSIAIITDNDHNNISGTLDVDMAWICAVQCDKTRVVESIKSNKTICEVAL